VKDNGDGTYTGTYNVDKPGDYTVDITLYDEPIRDMPKSVHVKASGQMPERATPRALASTTPPPTSLRSSPSTLSTTTATPAPMEVRTSRLSCPAPRPFTPMSATTAMVPTLFSTSPRRLVTTRSTSPWRMTPIKDMPRTINVKATPAAGKTWADGPGIESGKVFDNEPTYFTIHAVDHDGKPRTDGGDNFDVKINGPQPRSSPEVIDNGDGTYTVKYEPDVAW
jgi:hypothetical protein